LRRRPLAGDRFDDLEQLDQADGIGGPAADVEHVPGKLVDARVREQHRVDQVVGVEHVAHLQTVTVDRQRPTLERCNQKVGDPSLVLGAELVRSVDAAHTEHQGPQAEGAGVVEHILLGDSLRTTVRAVELEAAGFADAVPAELCVRRGVARRLLAQAHVFEIAVHLVGRGEQHRRRLGTGARRLQQVEGAAGIDLEIQERVGEAGRHRDLRGEVEDVAGALHDARHRGEVADVAHLYVHQRPVRRREPLHVLLDAGTRQVVEHDDRQAEPEQPIGHVRRNETGTPGNQNRLGHTVNPRAAR
jgi:hypothetical protein